MKTFEYKTFEIHQGPSYPDFTFPTYELNELGKQGWEAVLKIRKWYHDDCTERNWPIYTILFKREVIS